MGRSNLIVLVLILVAFTWGWLLGSTLPQASIDEWLNRWQTLIVGLLAFFGALFGAYAIFQQTAQAKGIEEQKRNARLLSVRSVLPLTLSSVMDQVRRDANLVEDIRAKRPVIAPEDISADVITALRDLIEYAEPEIAIQIRTILSDMQVLQTRVRNDVVGYLASSMVFPPSYLPSNLVRLASIYALTSALFRYARFETDRVAAIDFDAMTSAAIQLGIFDVPLVMTLIREQFGIDEESQLQS